MKTMKLYLSTLLVLLFSAGTTIAQEGGELPPEEQAKVHFNNAVEYGKDPSKEIEMVSEYQLCLNLDEKFVDAYINLGVHYFGKKNYAEAEKNFKKATEYAPQDTIGFDNLGKTYKELRKYAEASQTFEAGIAADANYVSGHKQLGDIFYKLKKYPESIAAYEKYLAAKSDDHIAQYGLGKAYEKSKQTQKALTAYRATVKLKPDYVNAHNRLGKIYLSQEKYLSAIRAYEKSVKHNPKGYRAWYNLAIAKQSNDPEDYSGALAAWKQAYKVCKNVPKAKDLAKTAKSQIAELEKAIKEAAVAGG